MGENNAEVSTGVQQKTGSENRLVSRRDFIKWATAGTLTAPFALKALEKAFYEALTAGLTNPDINDGAIAAALKISETAPASENPLFRPMAEIIEEGINGYTGKTGESVTYTRSKDYKDATYYANTIDRIAFSGLVPKWPSEVVDELSKAIPHEAYHAYLEGKYPGNMGFKDYFPLGSGFYERFSKKHPELIRSDGYIKNYDTLFDAMEKDGKGAMDSMIAFVEEQRVSNNKQPISSSAILGQFLEKNEGNVSNSIFDTALFLKCMARTDPKTGLFQPSKVNVEWYKKNILDEYQGPSYADDTQSADHLNIIGKPYHSWNLVALLKFFPNEVVRAGGLCQQLGSIGEQGVGKTRSDVQTLADLRSTEELLLRYAPTGLK